MPVGWKAAWSTTAGFKAACATAEILRLGKPLDPIGATAAVAVAVVGSAAYFSHDFLSESVNAGKGRLSGRI